MLSMVIDLGKNVSSAKIIPLCDICNSIIDAVRNISLAFGLMAIRSELLEIYEIFYGGSS